MEYIGRRDAIWGMYRAQIIDNDDPLKRGRVRFRIAGMIEPRSSWARREASASTWELPEPGQLCTVYFDNGDPDFPVYLPNTCTPAESDAQGPQPNIPPGGLPSFLQNVSPSETAKFRGLQTARWEILIDDRGGEQSILVRDRQFPENYIVLDGVQQTVSIRGVVGVNISAVGAVNIDGMAVTINGRTVLPGADPI